MLNEILVVFWICSCCFFFIPNKYVRDILKPRIKRGSEGTVEEKKCFDNQICYLELKFGIELLSLGNLSGASDGVAKDTQSLSCHFRLVNCLPIAIWDKTNLSDPVFPSFVIFPNQKVGNGNT